MKGEFSVKVWPGAAIAAALFVLFPVLGSGQNGRGAVERAGENLRSAGKPEVGAAAAKKTPPKNFLNLPAFQKKSGAPARTVSAATRAGGLPPIELIVLTPESAGFTYREQPSFFWYQSDSSNNNLIFNIYDPKTFKSVVRHRMTGALPAGIHRFDLGDHGKKVETGTRYLWSITYEVNPDAPSENAVSKGQIERIAAPKSVSAKLAGDDPFDKASILAQNGIWYDLFATITDLHEEFPESMEVKQARDNLIRQVGLQGKVSGDQ